MKKSSAVAKVWKNPENEPDRPKHETVALRLLHRRGETHVPRFLGKTNSPTILFEEKINGEPIKDLDEQTITDLANVLARIHSIQLNSYGKPLTERKRGSKLDCLKDGIAVLHELASETEGERDTKTLISQGIDEISKQAEASNQAFSDKNFTLVHFDLNRNNILRSPDGKMTIIDWEQASAGDNAMDIAKLFLKLRCNEDQKKQFLKLYEANLGQAESGFEERLAVYEPFVLINSLLWRLRVLRDVPSDQSSEEEKDFYIRVKDNFASEIESLKKFVHHS